MTPDHLTVMAHHATQVQIEGGGLDQMFTLCFFFMLVRFLGRNRR